jgi:hypothetical protein
MIGAGGRETIEVRDVGEGLNPRAAEGRWSALASLGGTGVAAGLGAVIGPTVAQGSGPDPDHPCPGAPPTRASMSLRPLRTRDGPTLTTVTLSRSSSGPPPAASTSASSGARTTRRPAKARLATERRRRPDSFTRRRPTTLSIRPDRAPCLDQSSSSRRSRRRCGVDRSHLSGRQSLPRVLCSDDPGSRIPGRPWCTARGPGRSTGPSGPHLRHRRRPGTRERHRRCFAEGAALGSGGAGPTTTTWGSRPPPWRRSSGRPRDRRGTSLPPFPPPDQLTRAAGPGDCRARLTRSVVSRPPRPGEITRRTPDTPPRPGGPTRCPGRRSS